MEKEKEKADGHHPQKRRLPEEMGSAERNRALHSASTNCWQNMKSLNQLEDCCVTIYASTVGLVKTKICI